jgi:hypothetical protein
LPALRLIGGSKYDQLRHLVQIKHKMANQRGIVLCTATAEIQLPKKVG